MQIELMREYSGERPHDGHGIPRPVIIFAALEIVEYEQRNNLEVKKIAEENSYGIAFGGLRASLGLPGVLEQSDRRIRAA